MTQTSLPRLVVTDERQMKLLLSVQALGFLECFMGRESTVSEAVAFKERRSSRGRVQYWLSQFVQAGLVAQVGERPQRGSGAPVYRSVADEFILQGAHARAYLTLPDGLMHKEQKYLSFLQEATTRHYQRLADDLIVRFSRPRAQEYALTEVMTRQELGGLTYTPTSPLQDDWLRVRLPVQAARAIQRDLQSIVERIKAAAVDVENTEHAFYIGHLALIEELP